jgi:hypothetical protein
MTEEEIVELRRRAEAGDAAAMTAFGKLLLGGDAAIRNVPAGARYIAQAAEKDDAEALAQRAVLVAAGIAHAPDWDRAFDLMQRAAQRGWAPAQEQLGFLAGRTHEDYEALRRGIDIAGWLRPPQATIVRERPHIATATGLMSKAECDRLIERARPRLHRAGVYDHATGDEIVVDHRSNSTAEFTLTEIDLHVVLLMARMSALLGLPSQCFELMNILHYAPGQTFKPHFDFLYADEPGTAAVIQRLGQRIVTLLVYLNEDYEGGETDFPRLGYSFKGRTGDALMFANVRENGAPEPLTLHAGLPPTSGEKWLLSQWVRNKPQGGPPP